jgi:hypothetical protein
MRAILAPFPYSIMETRRAVFGVGLFFSSSAGAREGAERGARIVPLFVEFRRN